MTTAELKRRATAGMLQPEDLLWPEDGDRAQAIAAGAALDFSDLRPASPVLPHWLSDVQEPRSAIGDAPLPDRRGAVGRVERMPDIGPGPPSDRRAAVGRVEHMPDIGPPLSQGRREEVGRVERMPDIGSAPPPDRREAVGRIERMPDLPARLTFSPSAGGQAAEPVAPPPVLPPARVEDIRVTETLLPAPAPAESAAPPAPAPVLSRPSTVPARPSPPRPSGAKQAKAHPPPPKVPGTIAPAASPESTGFDPETGQILDPERFREWQRSQTEDRQRELRARATTSAHEVFLEARKVLQRWVDADANEALVRSGDLAAIQGDPAVQQLVLSYERYGEAMLEKLWQHLELLVDNRRKFLAASR
jgi:hypothetical protein